ncbi:hypothetical protein [Acaryochloris sp. IP29b_bin.148]|uniref:hypothetical protein n=1 Tax=Acaryochloris sp. IP29b_bin.148 TaxID=2969218 RepID=UPI0026158912|nr:hypothetical protein [Acaryochloris sp. IP29b_bin.148]
MFTANLQSEYTITQDNLVEFKTPLGNATLSDAFSDLVRQGARPMIAQTVEVLAQYQDLKTESGHQGIVCNGYLPECGITTGVGDLTCFSA